MPHTLIEIFAERRLAVDYDHRVRQFWLALDERVHPGMAPPDEAQVVDRVSQYLFNRLEARAVLGRSGASPTFRAEATSPRTKAALEWVSALVRELHMAHLVAPGGEDLMAWALEQFVVGGAATFHADPELHRELLLHGAPNSSEFVKLPELALACIEHGIDVTFWETQLPHLVLAAIYFIATAEGPDKETATMVGAEAYNYKEGRRLSIEARAALRADLRTRIGAGTTADDYALEFSLLIASAFPGTTAGGLFEVTARAVSEGGR